MNALDRVDLTRRLPKTRYEKELPVLQARLHEVQAKCIRRGVASVLVFEGWDAAGKGGAIRRLTPTLDPRGFEVIPVAAPAGEDARHHYLWRFWRPVPAVGEMAIFDRSWYGRVLVERVEGFSAPAEWRRAYREIVEFERQLLSTGAVVLKFWLHISREEQLRRFRQRAAYRIKRYKIGPDDWRNRRKWPAYEAAVDEMVRRTHRPDAPWILVEAEDKRHARVRILETVVRALERALKRPSPAKRLRRLERRMRRVTRA